MILFYSGTGNSRYAAAMIAKETGGELVSMNDIMRQRIKNKENATFDFRSETPFVFVCPTYCWRVPRLVEQFIRESRFTGCKDAYFFLTCGSSTAAAAKYAEELCAGMGFHFMGLSSAVMPENYIAMFDSPDYDEAQDIIRAAESVIESAGKAIALRRPITDPNGGKGFKALPSIINPYFYRHSVSDKKFMVKDNCVGCGQCAKICPTVNITLENSRPIWHGNCTHCMGCISICPTEAIEYGRASRKRRRYYLDISGCQKKTD